MSVNLKTFPQLGAYPYEVGNSNSVGGINNSAMWPRNLPLSYWYNYGSLRKKSKTRSKKSRVKYGSKKRKNRLSRK